MGRMAPSLTSVDCVRLQHYVTLPGILGGSVTPNPRFWPYLVRKQRAAATIKFFHSLRKKYGPAAWSWFPFRRTLLVLDGNGINEVLASPENFADPFIKKLQLSAFTPHGAIISRPLAWEGRRALNNEALAFGELCHPDGAAFVDIVHHEVEKMLGARRESLAWHDFSALAARISQQVIFGIGQYREDVAMHLARLVRASNWGVIRRPADFSALHGCIDEQMNRRGRRCNEWHSLVQQAVAQGSTCSGTTELKASSQIAFWLFVMKDAIELHTVRTLALIASAPENVRQRLSDELACTRLNAWGIAQLDFLEACIKEALRLWTPVPNLLRVALADTELSDKVRVERGRQILMHTGSYHRNPEVFGAAADMFLPEQRRIAEMPGCCPVNHVNPPLYVFSQHQQSCSGQFLIVFLLKAVLASLLGKTNLLLLGEQIPMDPVPAAIDHFAIRFWRVDSMPGLLPPVLSRR
jgi:cytochrome P450